MNLEGKLLFINEREAKEEKGSGSCFCLVGVLRRIRPYRGMSPWSNG